MERKVILLILLSFLGISNHLQMFYYLVSAIPIYIQLVSNLKLFVSLGKDCVNENVFVSFSVCMYSHETKEVKNQYGYYTSSKGAEDLVEIN